MSSLIAWILRAIPFGTIIMYGALGETLTEKSGNLNLGVPGIMYLGGFAGFASAYYYEKLSANPSAFVCVILALLCALIASALGGLIYAFLTITLRANQNVTGLALTTFGMGVANFFGVFILNGASYTAAPLAYKAFSAMIPVLSGLGVVGKVLFSYGFLAYAAIVLAVVLHWFFTRTRAGLNLRAVGENPATADAAGKAADKAQDLADTGKAEAINTFTRRAGTATTVSQPASTAGRLLASNCFQCHGTNGKGPGFDKLAGKSASSLYSDLKEFQAGQEGNGIMAKHALGYTDAQLQALAQWLSTQR